MNTDQLEAARFFADLSVLLGSGVPLHTAVTAFAEETTSADLASALRGAAPKLEQDEEAFLRESLAGHASLFPGWVLGFLRAGEETGLLDAVSERIATDLAAAARGGETTPEAKHDADVARVLRLFASLLTSGVPAEDAAGYLPDAAETDRVRTALSGVAAALDADGSITGALAPVLEGIPEPIRERMAEAEKRVSEEDPEAFIAFASFPQTIAEGLEQGWLTCAPGDRPLRQELRSTFHLLARFLAGGVPVVKALPLLERATRSDDVRAALGSASRLLESPAGPPLSAALAESPRVFAPSLIALLRSHEESGDVRRAIDTACAALDRGLFLPRAG